MEKCKTCASHAIIPAIYIQSILIHPGMKSNKTLQMLQTLLLHFDFGNSLFKSLTFVGSASAWSFVFFIPATTANDLQLSKDFYPRCYSLHCCPILIIEKEPVFPFIILCAKQGNYWHHL